MRLYRNSAPKTAANALIASYRTYYTSAVQSTGANQGDCRGFDMFPLPYGKLAWRLWGDDGSGNVRDPRDVKSLNCACRINGVNRCNSKGSTFIVGQAPISFNAQLKPLYARNHGFRPEAWLADDNGRFYISSDETAGQDPLGLGGASACGVTIYDQAFDGDGFEPAFFWCSVCVVCVHSVSVKCG